MTASDNFALGMDLCQGSEGLDSGVRAVILLLLLNTGRAVNTALSLNESQQTSRAPPPSPRSLPPGGCALPKSKLRCTDGSNGSDRDMCPAELDHRQSSSRPNIRLISTSLL